MSGMPAGSEAYADDTPKKPELARFESELPKAGREVSVRILVHSIKDINIKEQYYEAKVFLEAEWDEERDNLDEENWGEGDPGKKMWTPYITWQNRFDTVGDLEKWYTKKELKGEDKVRCYQQCPEMKDPVRIIYREQCMGK